jgi:CDP-glycerol glycerophosphotransferase (TagB/SpsB family)
MTKFLSLLFLLPNWVAYAFSHLIKRDRNLFVFGVHTNSFSGNVKSLFLREDSEHLKVFISTNTALNQKLQASGFKAHDRYSFRGIYYSLTAGTYVYSGFPSDVNFWLSGGAKYVNVWHGTPIKKIERDVSTGYYSIRNRYAWLYKLAAPYFLSKPDALLTSSPYEEKCFKTAFALKNDSFVRAFPPRLEPLLHQRYEKKLRDTILYAPTWRDDHSYRVEEHIDWQSFNTFLQKNELVFYIKLHPSDKATDPDKEFSHITNIDRNADIYEHLGNHDMLVTDYSSMIFESLYLGKPVILFCPDDPLYQKTSREMYIDPGSQLPVKSSYSQRELEKSILHAHARTRIEPSAFEEFSPYAVRDKLLSELAHIAHSSAP